MNMKTIGAAAAISVACLTLAGCVSEGPSYGYERDVGTRFHGGRYYHDRDYRGHDRQDGHHNGDRPDRGDHHMNGAGRQDHGRNGGNGPGRGGQNNGGQNGGQGQNNGGGGDKVIVPNQ